MTLKTIEPTLDGDWRSRAYGADRLAHLFVWDQSTKKPACGSRNSETFARRNTTRQNACRECLRRVESWDRMSAEA